VPKSVETDAPEADDLTSRSDKKRASRVQEEALSRLSRELCALSEKRLGKLALPDDVLEAVLVAQRISSARARERQLRIVRRHLRDGEWGQVRDRLRELTVHGTVKASAASGEEREWVVRLIGEGNKALDALAEVNPRLDRRHFRQLIRNAASGSEQRRQRAEEKLAAAVRTLLRLA
jgi:ribosomal 50S subunit-associated protein YjgA (DUF615 family)